MMQLVAGEGDDNVGVYKKIYTLALLGAIYASSSASELPLAGVMLIYSWSVGDSPARVILDFFLSRSPL